MNTVIEVTNLTKRYGAHTAVDGISFNVRRGEIFAIAGPNGAGKSTTVESIIGLREPDAGRVKVLGLDPHSQRVAVAQRIGIQLQQAALADRIRVWEALDLYASFYEKTVPYGPLLERWGLADKRNDLFRNLSGGQKQRLFISLALLNDPEVVFLDELTTGLDPQARRKTWELVEQIRAEGKTVVLVTHFMDEAEALADRIAIIDNGRIIALDAPQELIRNLGGEKRVVFETVRPIDLAAIRALPSVLDLHERDGVITVCGHDERLVTDVVLAVESAAAGLHALRTEQPTLEDVFLALTGREVRD